MGESACDLARDVQRHLRDEPSEKEKTEEIAVTTVAYLNRWPDLDHLMLAVLDGDVHRRLDSQFYTSLDDARRVLGRWPDEYATPAQNVHDNSNIDLDILFARMDVDLEGDAESNVAGSLS